MARQLRALGTVAAALLFAACTQSSPPAATAPAATAEPAVAAPAATEDVEAVVTQLEHEWVDAIVKKDTATIDRLLADDFAGTSPTAHSYTKTMAMEELLSGKYVVDSMTLDELSVNSYFGNVAIAFSSQEEKSHYDGKDVSGHYHFTDVWVKRDGRWQCVASHGTRFDTGHAKTT